MTFFPENGADPKTGLRLRSEEKILILVFEEVNCTTTTPNYISCCDTFFIFRALCSDITKALSRKKRRPSWRPTSVCWKKKFLLKLTVRTHANLLRFSGKKLIIIIYVCWVYFFKVCLEDLKNRKDTNGFLMFKFL